MDPGIAPLPLKTSHILLQPSTLNAEVLAQAWPCVGSFYQLIIYPELVYPEYIHYISRIAHDERHRNILLGSN